MTRPFELTAIPSACRMARWHVKDVLRRWGLSAELEWQTAQVVSELIGNCCSHTARAAQQKPLVCSLTLRLYRDGLYIEVSDPSPDPLVPRDPGCDDESGRGLRIVAMLCVRVKVLATPPGKTVVAVIPREVLPLRPGARRS